MFIIGIDVATKSLAISVIKYKSNKIVQEEMNLAIENYKSYKKIFINNKSCKNPNDSLNNLLKKYQELLECINSLLCPIEILFVDVKDLIPDKKLKDTNILERTNNLRDYLNDIDKKISELNIPIKNLDILIEYQMGPNDKSRVISSQLLYHFSKYSSANIELVGPSLKNSIFFKNNEESHYSKFLEKYSTNYSANKAHSKYLFLELLKNIGKNEIISNIKKKNIDDIADSVLMSISWLKKNEIL